MKWVPPVVALLLISAGSFFAFGWELALVVVGFVLWFDLTIGVVIDRDQQ